MTDPQPLCGITHDYRGTEYPPCTRPAGHYEVYCHSTDGARFLAHPDEPAAGTDAAALLADNQHLRQQLAAATEFRLVPAPPAYTPLIVRRDRAYDGTRWAVLHDPGDRSVRRAWTADGWEMTWASSHDEIFCWPDAETALAQARLAQANDDREPDVDGAGRTPDSYRDHRAAARPAATTQDGQP